MLTPGKRSALQIACHEYDAVSLYHFFYKECMSIIICYLFWSVYTYHTSNSWKGVICIHRVRMSYASSHHTSNNTSILTTFRRVNVYLSTHHHVQNLSW